MGMIPGHHFHQSSSLIYMYILNTLHTLGNILFQKRDMGLKDKAQKHCTLRSMKGRHNIPKVNKIGRCTVNILNRLLIFLNIYTGFLGFFLFVLFVLFF